jgi:hypothetical protein
MLTSLSGRCIGVFAAVCVLLMFLFPLPQGNFQSTHGPTTALRSQRASLVLVFTIITAALTALFWPTVSLLARSFGRAIVFKDQTENLAGPVCVLRC